MISLITLSWFLIASAAPAETQKPKLIVLDLASSGGIDPATASAITEAIVSEIASRGVFTVVSSREVETMLGIARQKQMLGCADDSSCLAELAGGMGVQFVLRGSLAKIGDAFQLTLQTLDGAHAQALGRSTKLAASLTTLRSELPYAVAEATGTPLPPPPSRTGPYVLMGGGAALVIAGAVVGIDGLSRQRSITDELQASTLNPSKLSAMSQYQSGAQLVSLEKTAALLALVAGAGLIGLGLYVNPPEGPRVALVPTGNGLFFVGSW